MASDLAEEALRLRDRLPLETELSLAARLRYEPKHFAPPGAAALHRHAQASCWVHAIKRLAAARDLHIDPNYRPALNFVPPGFEDLPAGASATALHDPARRAAYEQALRAENARAQSYLDHVSASRWSTKYLPQFENYLTDAYTKATENDAELQDVIRGAALDGDSAARIIRAVEQKRAQQ
jgi:hypothetical protein